MGLLVSMEQCARLRRKFGVEGKRVVFTNGTFDILHRGHVEYLAAARRLGDVLIVGLNSDASIRRIKGNHRPINPNRDRAAVLCALASVDLVVIFGDDTPAKLIAQVIPDVLVKGADWKPDAIVGAGIVLAHGGVVKTIRLTKGRSTTTVIHRVLERYRPGRRA